MTQLLVTALITLHQYCDEREAEWILPFDEEFGESIIRWIFEVLDGSLG